MRYEAVFGDQSLFDGCYDETASIVIATSNGRKFVAGEFTEYGIVEGDVKSDGLRIAMRRIIAEPKRWTVEDQKAGRLPEVGAKCRHGHKEETVIAVTENFVVTECLDGAVCTTRKFEFMASYNPVETPEEKAARLSEEWVDNATFMTTYEIYDALLSGELTMPGKDDEDHR